jgi:hypothetical protein
MFRIRLPLAIVFCFIFVNQAEAATIYIDPGVATLYRGDAITTSVRLMPDQNNSECINTVDAVIRYPDNIQPVDVSIGRSIFSVWVEPPTINKEEKTITFAGGIPNGYCGRVQGDPGFTNVIADIIFRSPGLQIGSSPSGNTALIDFAPETTVYLNDGQGTKAPLLALGSTLTLEPNAGPGIVDVWREEVQQDDILPEEFSITLEKDPVAFSGRYYIIFSTTDKQTGVSHYEVMEEPSSEFSNFTWGGTDAPWVRETSPYVLKDQSLNSTIRVRAFDKAGNQYVATLVPDESIRSISKQATIMYVVVGVGLVVLFGMIVGLLIWFKNRKKVLPDNDTDTDNDENNDDVVL